MAASTDPPPQPATQRVLLVEDNYLVASMLENMLLDFGWQVVGPVPSVNEGLELAQSEPLTGAILDINILGGTSAPIAEVLRRRRLPFIFITGYASPHVLPEPLVNAPKLIKPIDNNLLINTVHQEFTPSQPPQAEG